MNFNDNTREVTSGQTDNETIEELLKESGFDTSKYNIEDYKTTEEYIKAVTTPKIDKYTVVIMIEIILSIILFYFLIKFIITKIKE